MTMATIVPKRQRRWLRSFVLLILLAIGATIAVGLLLAAQRVRRAEEAVARLRQMGAQVTESYEVANWWRQLARSIGLSPNSGHFGRMAASVTMAGPNATADALAVAADHPELCALALRDATAVDDAALAMVRDCTGVERLFIQNARIGDAGLRHLEKWSRLNTVAIDSCDITDDGVAFLSGLPSMQWVHCSGSGVTGATVRDLTFTGLDGAAPMAGKPLSVQGRLIVKTVLPAGVVPTVMIFAINEDASDAIFLRGTAVVTMDTTGEGTFTALCGNGGRGELQPGRHSIQITVTIPGKPSVSYRQPAVPFDFKPAAPPTKKE
ncbi:MAG: hypothetical protein U0746_05030 [Gemmataceae bacterium]